MSNTTDTTSTDTPLPADASALAEFMNAGTDADVNAMYDRLVAEFGQARTDDLWTAACNSISHDAQIVDALGDLGSALDAMNMAAYKARAALRRLVDGDAWHIEIAEGQTGRDIGAFLDDIARYGRAAEVLYQKAAGA